MNKFIKKERMSTIQPLDTEAIENTYENFKDTGFVKTIYKLTAHIRKLQTKVAEVESLQERAEKAEKDRERFLSKLVAIRMECDNLVVGANRNRFDQGCKWVALKIQKIIGDVGEQTKGDSTV